MKKIFAMLLAVAMLFALVACGSDTQQKETSPLSKTDENTNTTDNNEPPEESEIGEPDNTDVLVSDGENILIAYFSKSGNTETIANMIAEQTGGKLFKVETETPYPEDYDETVDIAREEQDNDTRPELSTHVEDMNQYDIIYLGYPIWWGTMPQAIFTFLEEYDFSGKTIIPFCTHGGSALGRSESDITNLVPDVHLLSGLAVSDSRVDDAQAGVEEWLNDLEVE